MEQLGIDPVMILVQIFNFALLLFVMKRYLYKPILSVIQKRRETLEDIAKGKQTIEEKLNDLQEEEKKLRQVIQQEKEQLLDEARRQAQQEKKELIEKANANAKEILKKADQQAQRITKNANQQIQEEAVKIASVMVIKIMSETIGEDQKSRSVEDAINRLEQVEV